MIQAVVRKPARAGHRRRRRVGRAAESAGRPVPPEIQHPRSVRDLRGPDRSRTRAARSCSTSFSAYAKEPTSRLSLVLVGHSLLPDSRAPAHPPSRLPGRRRQVRRHGRGGSPDHAVLLREPVDGGARGVGARQAGPRQREVRGAEGPVRAQQRGALYYERYSEFAETLHAIEHNRWLSGSLGRNGRQYFQNNYDWRVIERKYLDMLAQLQARPCPAHHGSAAGPGRTAPRRPRGGPGRARRPAGRVRPGPEARVVRIHQVLATLGYGDAIGHEVLGIQRVLRAAGHESEIFVETADSAPRVADARLPRAGGLQRSRQPAAPPFLARVEGLAHGVRAARSDGAHLPQHHAARVLRRRPPDARAPVFPRPPRASRLRESLRPRDGRLGVQPPGPDAAGVSAHGRAAGRSRFLASRSAAPNRARRRPVRRRLDEHPVRGPGDREQEDRGRHPLLSRLPLDVQPPLAGS